MRSMARRPERVMLVSVGIGVALVLGKLVVGLLTGSLGILSEAVPSSFARVASTFTLVAVGTARKPAAREHPYGQGRGENLAAFTEGVVLLITALGIAFEAIRRLTAGGSMVNPAGYAFALLIGTLVIETGRAFVLRRVGRLASSDAMLADATDRLADVLATVAVLAGLVGVRMGFSWADSVAALLVAGIIFRAAGQVAWRSGDILIDRSAAGPEKQIRAAIKDVDGVREVRSVRVRRSGPNFIGDVHIATGRMLPVEAAAALLDDVKRRGRCALPTLDLSGGGGGPGPGGGLAPRLPAG